MKTVYPAEAPILSRLEAGRRCQGLEVSSYVCALDALHLPAAGRSSANPTLAGFRFQLFQFYDFLRNSSGAIPDSLKIARNVPSGISPEWFGTVVYRPVSENELPRSKLRGIRSPLTIASIADGELYILCSLLDSSHSFSLFLRFRIF